MLFYGTRCKKQLPRPSSVLDIKLAHTPSRSTQKTSSTLDSPSTSSNKTASIIEDKSTKEVLQVVGEHGGNPDKFSKFPRGVTYQVDGGASLLWLQFRPNEVQQYSFYADLQTFTLKFEATLESRREITKLRWYGLELPVTKVRVPTSPSWTIDTDDSD